MCQVVPSAAEMALKHAAQFAHADAPGEIAEVCSVSPFHSAKGPPHPTWSEPERPE